MTLRSISDIPGASVEHNTFCVSVHFRNCEESSWEDVQVRALLMLQAHGTCHGVRHARRSWRLRQLDSRLCCECPGSHPVAEASSGASQAVVQQTLAEHSELKLTRGRKVLELRPEVFLPSAEC